MAESRGGRGNAVLAGFRLHRPAAKPSARGQIPRSFGQECPWSRYAGMLWYSRMPRPPAGEPRTTGTQCLGFGRVPNCVGISIALSCWQYALPWASEGAFRARTFWSVWTDNTATVAYINRQGSLRSRRMSQLARHLLLWSQKHPHFKSVQSGGRRAISSGTSWGVETPSPGGPADLESVRSCSGRPVASPEATHCQWFCSLSEATLSTDALAHSWPQGLRKYAFPPVSLLAQTLCKIREDEEQVILVAPYWPNRTWFPELMLLATASPWSIPLRKDLLSQRRGTLWHPRPDLHVWSLDGTGGSRWPAPGGSSHYRFSTSTVHKTGLWMRWTATVRG